MLPSTLSGRKGSGQVIRAAQVHLLLVRLAEGGEVAHAGVAELHLAALLHLEPLLGAAVGLELGHLRSLFVGLLGSAALPRRVHAA
jgi:hypothetical protein